MKDRVPKYPGRVKITRSDGTSEYATIERADEPVSGNEGTPLNKATLLSDDTAAMLGFATSDDPTVDDALQGLYEHICQRGLMESGYYTGTGATLEKSLSFDFAPKAIFISTETRAQLSYVIMTDMLPTSYSSSTNALFQIGSGSSDYYQYAKKNSDGTCITWRPYNSKYGYGSPNETGEKYYYVAIG